jgi:SWIM/SEC-C metal-binding protein
MEGIMAKLGSHKKPAIVRVQTEERGREVVDFCNKHGWQVIVGIEPDKPEDISDVNRLLKNQRNRSETPIIRTPMKVSPNDYCPCGSGLKYKKCCMSK